MSSEQPRKPKKKRLDLLVVERGLADSREKAKRYIMAGEVRVDGQVVDKAGHTVPEDAAIELSAQMPFVSRGGMKLAAALDEFPLVIRNRTAVDVGASTGGFTDCLLQHGAAHVYAIDVGYGQLAWKLRNDPRVTVLERTNIRYLEELPDSAIADLAVIDASFISLELVLPATLRLLTSNADVVALIKPQFEAGRDQVGKGGVIRDERIHRQVIEKTWAYGQSLGLYIGGLCVSPLLGPAGNTEFLIWLQHSATSSVDYEQTITKVLTDARLLRKRKH